MSDIHNHLLCGMESLRNLKDEGCKEIIHKNLLFYKLGCMGGDIFYYRAAAKSHADPWVKNIGDFMHINPNQFFEEAKKVLAEFSLPETSKITAYLLGFINHHALDAQTHPFINYFGGIAVTGREETKPYQYTHKRLEILCDVTYAKFRNLPLENVLDITEIHVDDVNLINRFLSEIIKNLKKEIIPNDMISICLRDYKKLIKITKNCRFLRPLFSTADAVLHQKYRFERPFFSMAAKEKKLDVMNLSHRLWLNPCDKNEIMDFSYPELFEYAVKAAAKRMKRYYGFLHGSGNDKSASSIFKNISYVTGSEIFKESDIVNFDVIL